MSSAHLATAHKKLGEAQHFLNMMLRQKRSMDWETFDFHLSAFLSAARSVDYKLRNENHATYPKWRDTWDARNPAEAATLKFFADDRAGEVHAGGSARKVGSEGIEVYSGSSYSDASGKATVVGPPGVAATIYRPVYTFRIGNADRDAADACAGYLALLRRLVSDFAQDVP